MGSSNKFDCHNPAPFQKPVQVQGSTSKGPVLVQGSTSKGTSTSARKHQHGIRWRSWWSSFAQLGNIAGKKRGGSKPRVRTPDTVGTIHASVAWSPTRKSVRQLAAENKVSPSTAWLILRADLRMHPYKIHVFLSLTTVCREKWTSLRRNSVITCSRILTLWNTFVDMDMSYARRVRTASYSLHTSHSVSHDLHQRIASHSSYILHLTSYTLHLTSYVLRLTSYTLRLTSYILHLTPYILHLTPYILHLTPYALRLTPYALRLTSYILRLTSYILHLISYRIVFCTVWHVYVCV
jgi:hypothetical protein